MMRSTFFSAGLFIALCGVACLFVDKIELKMKGKPQQETGFRGFLSRMGLTNPQPRKVVQPPEWAAFTMLSIGAVTMLYAVALPKKKKD